MGIVTKNYLLKDINRDYLDMIAKDYDLNEDKAEFVIKGFSLAPNEMKFDDGESSSIDILSTKSIDRDGDVVDPNGVVFDIFRKHPVCVWCHDYKQLPVGKSAWIKNSAGEAVVAKTIYAVKSNPLAKQIYEYRKDGFPLGKSLGFVPVEWEDYNPKVSKGMKKKYNRVILLEYSDVPMPSNTDVLQLAVSKGLIKQDYPKMFYFHDLDIKAKDYILEFDKEEKDMGVKAAEEEVKKTVDERYSQEETKEEERYSQEEVVEKVAKREDVNEEEGKEEYGDVEFADEKNKKYPIDTEEHVRAALSYWGMPKNREKYSTEDQEVIGKKIRAAAKKLGIGVEEEKKEADAEKIVSKEAEEITQKRFMESFPSVSDVMNALHNKLRATGASEIAEETTLTSSNQWVMDLFPTNYPNGKVVFSRAFSDGTTRMFSADYVYENGKVELANTSEVKEAYVKKSFLAEILEKQADEFKEHLDGAEKESEELVQKNTELEEQINEFREDIEYLTEKINAYSDEIERLKEVEEELIVVKEGRVLSGKNKKLINDCISALQALMDATEIVGKEVEEVDNDLIELSEIESKAVDDNVLDYTKEDISEITKKAISMINMPTLNIANIVDKVEAKIRGKAVI